MRKSYGVPGKLFNILFSFLFASCSLTPAVTAKTTPAVTPPPTTPPIQIPDGNGGGLMIFASDRIAGRMELFLVNADGSQLTQITATRADELAPAWSPDGSKIAYLIPGSSGLMLKVIDLDGLLQAPDSAQPISVTTRTVEESTPAWTSDSQMLIYASSVNSQYELFLTSLDGETDLQLTASDSNERHPALSPDGSRLVYSSDRNGDFDLFVIDEFDLQAADFTASIQISSLAGDELFPVWSPEGERLVFTSTADGNKDLLISSWNGEDLSPLADSSADEWKASWNSNGDQLVYSYFNFDLNLNDLLLINLETQETSAITADQFDNWWPDWMP